MRTLPLLTMLLACTTEKETPIDSGGVPDTTIEEVDTAAPVDTADTAAPTDTADTAPVDADGDGYDEATDCDDGDAAVHPGAEEVCNDVDDDCDDAIDEDGVCDDTGPVTGCDALTMSTVHAVPATHTTIQAAIDAAADGDGICVAAGTYLEALDLGGRDVWIMGEDGAAATWVTASGTGPVLTIDSGEDATVQGLTLSQGAAETGAGIFADGVTLTLRDVVVTDSTASGSGGGITIFDSDVHMEQVTVTGNQSGYSAAGVLLKEGASVTMQDCEVSDNDSTGWGGGGMYVVESELTASSLVVRDNTRTGSDSGGGGAIYLDTTTADITNAVFIGNVDSGRGGAFYPAHSATFRLTNVAIVGNTALNGGAVFLLSSSTDFVLHNSVVAHNTSTNTADAFYVYTTLDPTVTYTALYGHSTDTFYDGTDLSSSGGNIEADPDFTAFSTGTAASTWDLTLASGSDLVDAGDPDITDPDGSTSDMGAYGGPGGSW